MSPKLWLPLALVVAIVTAAFWATRDGGESSVDLEWTLESGCPDAVIIGAAGSGQRDDVLGVGPQVASVVEAFEVRLLEEPSATLEVGFTALDYPAPGLLDGGLLGFLGNSISDSIDDGSDTLVGFVSAIVDRCDDPAIYLVGYSQGASVVRSAVGQLTVESQAAVAGVVVLADPNRDADDPLAQSLTNEIDPALATDIASHTRDGVLGGMAVPDWLTGSFYSGCARRDAICNFNLGDLLATDAAHTEETYNGLGPQLGVLLADDLISQS